MRMGQIQSVLRVFGKNRLVSATLIINVDHNEYLEGYSAR